MSEENKVTYIQTSEHSMVAGEVLEPGGRVLLNEDNDSHKHLKKLIEAQDPSVEHLSLQEVDPQAEKDAAEEREEMLAKAAKIAAEAREEESRAAAEHLEEVEEAAEGQTPHIDEPDTPPQDEEAIALAKQSGAGQRASTQEDVADEDKGDDEGKKAASPRRRRSSSSDKGE